MPRKYSYYISRSIEIPARALFLFQVTGRGKSKIANDFQDHRSILTDINWFFNDHQKLFFISFGISSSVEINRAIREQSRSILSSNSFFFFQFHQSDFRKNNICNILASLLLIALVSVINSSLFIIHLFIIGTIRALLMQAESNARMFTDIVRTGTKILHFSSTIRERLGIF